MSRGFQGLGGADGLRDGGGVEAFGLEVRASGCLSPRAKAGNRNHPRALSLEG